MSTGLVLGKFMPLHKGHEYLIHFAASQVDKLYLLVCGIPSEPIPLNHRYNWTRQVFGGYDNITVIKFDEDIQQAPKDDYDHDFWYSWKDAIYRYTQDNIDFVFTSEMYGFRLAYNLDATHIPCNMNRNIVPVSGTYIRHYPMTYWEYISESAKPYFVKVVTVGGPESTGKSTLTEKLAKRFNTVYVSEYGRDYLEQRGNYSFDSNDIKNICYGHCASKQALSRQANKILFVDTDPIITHLFSNEFLGFTPEIVKQKMSEWVSDLTLVTMPNVGFYQDGTRMTEGIRKQWAQKYIDNLNKLKQNYKLIDKQDWSEREKQAISYVNTILGY